MNDILTLRNRNKIRYLIALGLIGFISISFFIYASFKIREAKQFAEIINKAGRQRMLSQRTVILRVSGNSELKNQLLQEMAETQVSLDCGNLTVDCDKELNSQIIKMLNAHANILNSPSDEDVLRYVSGDLSNFLQLLDQRVGQFQKTSEQLEQRLLLAEQVILLIIIITLILEAILIFRPMFNGLYQMVYKLEEKNKENSQLIKEKEKLLNEIGHDLRTPLNELFFQLRKIEESNPNVSNALKKIQNTIDYILSFHKNEKTDYFSYHIMETLYDTLTTSQKEYVVIKEIENDAFFLMKFNNIKNLIHSAYYMAESHGLKIKITMGECLDIEFSGDQDQITLISSLFNEKNSFPDVIHATFFKEIVYYNTFAKQDYGILFFQIKFDRLKKNQSHDVTSALIIDDNVINLKIMQSFLKKLGIDSDVGYNGEQAVIMTQTKQYDIIFIDIKMPVMSGPEAIRNIREFNSDVHIVTISANAFYDDILDSLQSGSQSFVPKPINLKRLTEEVNFAKNHYSQLKVIF